MKVSFQKWHGCKNDFIVTFIKHTQTDLLDALQQEASRLCAKDGSSVGADGILVLEFEASSEMSFYPKQLHIINQDGSLAQNCGNGLRCAALACFKRAHDYERHLDIPDSFELTVMDHDFLCRFSEDKTSEGLPKSVTISMGVPQLDEKNDWHSEALKKVEAENTANSSSLKLESLSTCTLSNQHIVLLTKEAFDRESFFSLASRLQKQASWNGINVHLARETDEGKSFEILHFERGVGPTKACGSGSSSLAASVFSDGFFEEGQSLQIKMPGGIVSITYRGENAPLEMTGPADFIFEGLLDL